MSRFPTIPAITAYLCLAVLAASPLASRAGAVPDLVPVPHPGTATFEPGIRFHIERVRAVLDATARESATAATLAHDYGALGNLYASLSAYDAALACYQNAAALVPGEFTWHYFGGRVSELQGDNAAAALAYAAAVERDPDYLAASIRLARMEHANGNSDSASARLTAAIAADPQNASALALLAEIAAAAGDHATAIELLQRALQAQPDADALYVALAMAYQKSGNIERAREAVRLRGERQPELADRRWQNMLSAQPKTSAQYLQAASEAAASGRYEEGLTQLELAVASKPDSVVALETLGRALFALGRPAEAAPHFEQALEAQPDASVSNFFLGLLQEYEGKDRAAIRFYRRSVAGGETILARSNLANALMREGRYEEAADHFAYLGRQRQDDTRPRYWQGVALMALGRCRDAAAVLEEALRMRPQTAQIIEALVRIKATCLAGDSAARQWALDNARLLYESHANASYAATLAMALAANREFDEAIRLQAEALRASPPAESATLRANLRRYERRRGATRPWPDGHGRLAPARAAGL